MNADFTVDSSLASAEAEQTYIVEAGDTLSKISKQFYGEANLYMNIFEANRDKLTDPNRIQPGMELSIPLSDKQVAS